MARILLADDDAATRDLIGRALKTEGHDVVAVEDGLAALAHMQSAMPSPDLLISDVQMPGLDGVSLAGKAVQIAPGLRVLLMSGFAGALGQTDHLKPHLKRVLTKPLSLDDVRSAVRAALAG